MIIFFDVGTNGAVSFFQNQKFKKVVKFRIPITRKDGLQQKLCAWYHLLQQMFPDVSNIDAIGCFTPYGTNRKTIANLAMLNAVIIIYFFQPTVYLITEWVAWKSILKAKNIPLRKIKKQLTIDWAKQNIKNTDINDNEADAILGGFYLAGVLALKRCSKISS